MQKKIFLFILFFFNIIKFISSTYSFGTSIPNSQDNFEYSMEKDMGQCTCDLSNLCDYNCNCDKDCGYTEIKGKDRLEEYKCKSLREKFRYNKDEAGISVKDHIFSLMCIHTDNSGDMGEFYKEEPNENKEDKKNNWINEFFEALISQNNEGSVVLYKPDSNGNCMKTYISELKNTEFSCVQNVKVDTLPQEINTTQRFFPLPNTDIIYYSNLQTRIIDFKVSWNTDKEDKQRPKGYLQGSPLKIYYDNPNPYDQYYLPIIDNQGNCLSIDNLNSAISIRPILFKNNAIYSCRIRNNDIVNTFFYNFLYNARICSSPDKEECNININRNQVNEATNHDNNFNLYIFTSKEGKESSPYEVVKGSLVTSNQASSNNENSILTLSIKFIDVSSSSYYNSKDGKITSLSSLSKNLLDSISIND